jgi:hypothetical protein
MKENVSEDKIICVGPPRFTDTSKLSVLQLAKYVAIVLS